MVPLLMALGSLGVNQVHAQGSQQPRRAIELSETNSAEILTNLDQLTTRKEGFKQLEERLKSLRGISPGSLEDRFNAPYVSPTMSVLPNKTIKDLLDRQRTWNLTPEELGAAINLSDSDALTLFGDDKKDGKDSKDGKDGKDSKKSLQQFYDNLNRQPASREKTDRFLDSLKGNSSKSADLPDARDDDLSTDDSKLPAGIRDKAEKLKEMVNEDTSSIFNPSRAKSSFDNFFGLIDNSPNKDALDGSKSSMESFIDKFKQTLDPQSTGPSMDPALKALVPDTWRQNATYPGMSSLPSSPAFHDLTESAPADLNSVLNRAAMPDINNTVLNQWNPMYTAPKPELPKVVGPSAPFTLDMPRRHF
jgi:hypothetical protein